VIRQPPTGSTLATSCVNCDVTGEKTRARPPRPRKTIVARPARERPEPRRPIGRRNRGVGHARNTSRVGGETAVRGCPLRDGTSTGACRVAPIKMASTSSLRAYAPRSTLEQRSWMGIARARSGTVEDVSSIRLFRPGRSNGARPRTPIARRIGREVRDVARRMQGASDGRLRGRGGRAASSHRSRRSSRSSSPTCCRSAAGGSTRSPARCPIFDEVDLAPRDRRTRQATTQPQLRQLLGLPRAEQVSPFIA